MNVVLVQDITALTAWHAVEVESRNHDHVACPADPLEERLPLLDPSTPNGGEKTLLCLGLVDGTAVAAAELLIPMLDNLGAVGITGYVRPGYRRRGHGRDLLDAVLRESAALGRLRMHFEVASPYPTGPALAERLLSSVGARPVLKEVRRLLDLHEQDVPTAPTPPTGYRLLQWVDRVPDEHLDDMAYLMHRMSTDAPLEQMDWEPEIWDAERYRNKEASADARGRTRFGTLAVEQSSGRAVAFTDIGVSRYAPEVGYQWETIVLTEHRGHGLGFVMKAHNHRQLADGSPTTRWINTWNAESNTHMVGINERLGFRPVEYETAWQLDR
ncbi:MAG: GNAT family N-acetyltransferase [Mycobacteriales bacterium]